MINFIGLKSVIGGPRGVVPTPGALIQLCANKLKLHWTNILFPHKGPHYFGVLWQD